MKNDLHLALHGLAIKKHATVEAVAGIIGMDPTRTLEILTESVGRGRVMEAKGKYTLAPAARIALESDYSRAYGDVRESAAFVAAYEQFERVNLALKGLITDWQVVDVAGVRVPNDHSDAELDAALIDRLGDLHERAVPVLDRLAEHVSRLAIYRDKLGGALDRAERGEIEWVSDAKIESYHTVWFELHEDLLRILGRTRSE